MTTASHESQLTEHQFRILLKKVFDEHLWDDVVDPENVNYQEAMEFLRNEPIRYDAVGDVALMREGDEALVFFQPDKDSGGALGYEVRCVGFNERDNRPIVRVTDYDAVKRDQSAIGGKKPTEFVPESDFILGRNSQTRCVQWMRRPVWR